MQVASIVPMPYLHLVKDKSYHLCLAHLALRFSGYRDFYKGLAESGKFVILDNGAAEGETVEIERLVELAVYMKASELVLPDFLGDYDRTLDEAYRALHYVRSKENYKGRIMVVPQAPSFEKWLSAACEMLEWPVDTIGIPKFLTYAFGPYARLLALNQLKNRVGLDFREIHLLGCAYDPREVGAISVLSPVEVRGVDSSLPYLYTREGHNLLYALREGIPRSQTEVNFYESDTDASLLAANIQIWERMCQGELM